MNIEVSETLCKTNQETCISFCICHYPVSRRYIRDKTMETYELDWTKQKLKSNHNNPYSLEHTAGAFWKPTP